MRWRLVFTALAGILASLPLLGPPLLAQDAGLRVGSAAPVVTVDDLDGRAVNLGQWVGKKPVLLEFWATWCTNCEELLPRLREAKRAVGDKVEFIAVNVTVNQTPDRVRRFLQDHDVPFHILYDDRGTSTRAYQAPATSYVVIADAKGRVAYTGIGGDQVFEPALRLVAGIHD
jgi:thiol-disulfide isomerase/thioredoxin